MADERPTYEASIKALSPPWLQRSVGGRVMAALGAAADTLRDRTIDAVTIRFPGLLDTSSLPMIGRERRIRRGPGETATTYAQRLRPWWDRHRVRGGPYALLGQLHDFFRHWLNVRMDVVYHSGTRRWIDEDGVITRDAITWTTSPDGTDEWSHIWVVLFCPPTIVLEGDLLVTTWNELITTFGGEPIGTSYTVTLSALTEAEAEVFRCIPREWSAAHIPYVTVVLLYGVGELWDYPQDHTADALSPLTLVNVNAHIGDTVVTVLDLTGFPTTPETFMAEFRHIPTGDTDVIEATVSGGVLVLSSPLTHEYPAGPSSTVGRQVTITTVGTWDEWEDLDRTIDEDLPVILRAE